MPAIPPRLLARLYRDSEAARWNVSTEAYEQALGAGIERAFAGRAPSPSEIEKYTDTLHLRDLALAVACASGSEPAWEEFVQSMRPVLYRSADALDPSGAARETADALYAELFGVGDRGSRRESLLRHYHGRSSLATWLRAVLSQRYVDRLRAGRRLEPLPDDPRHEPAVEPAAADPDRLHRQVLLQRALIQAVAALDARDRLRLACYYNQQLTLAATGRILGEHEATVSRQLARTRRSIREAVERALQAQGLTPAAIDDSLTAAVEDPGTLDLGRILGKESVPDRSI